MTRYKSYSTYKSSGVEWLEKIPSNWSVVPLKRYSNYIARGLSPNYSENDEGIPIINQACIHWEGLKLENVKFQETSKLNGLRGKLFPGDLLINSTGTGTLGRVGIFDLKNEHLADSHVTIVRINKNLFVKFVYYLLQTDLYQGYVYSSLVTGATNQIELSREGLGNTPIIIPTFQEQKLIVKFLDRETTRIDTLITKKCELINLLEKKRTAIITKAVTKGLNSQRLKKDNRLEWLDKIPEHWTVKRLKFVAQVQSGLTLGKNYTGRNVVTRPYLRVANVQDGFLDLERIAEVFIPFEDIARYELKSGDVLMTEGGDFDKLGRGYIWQGQIEGCLHQNHVFAVRPYPEALNSNYLAALMTSHYGKAYFTSTAQQTTNLATTNRTKLSNFPLPLPDVIEQENILTYLHQETIKILQIKDKLQQQIDALHKYRQALITAAVTGKIDVREEVERGAA
jgi:type I restriction enzyme S subunit